MNKNDLINKIAEKTGMSKSDTQKCLDGFIGVVSGDLKAKEKVTLVGFGTFAVAHRKEKQGVNPKTGARITIAAKDVPVFKAGKALKEIVK